jgi:excisionase family DNA binding protein
MALMAEQASEPQPTAETTEVAHIAPTSSARGSQWLSLKDASDFLGVHFTTLRGWADRGEIPVFRTPGGHRRFSVADLRRFLAERSNNLARVTEAGLVEVAVARVRQEIEREGALPQRWHYQLEGDAQQERRQRGRQLFSLAVSYVLKPHQRSRILENGRELGFAYGQEAVHSGVSLAETGRAVQFFRRQLVEVMHAEDTEQGRDAADLQIERLIDQFIDEVLYAVLDGYEQSKSSS